MSYLLIELDKLWVYISAISFPLKIKSRKTKKRRDSFKEKRCEIDSSHGSVTDLG